MFYRYKHGKKESKKGIRILSLSLAGVLGLTSYAYGKLNPYDKNVIKFGEGSKYSLETQNLISDYFNYIRFESMMNDFANNNFENYSIYDVDYLVNCLNVIAKGDLDESEKKFLIPGYGYKLDKVGFSMMLENYFPEGTDERDLVGRFMINHGLIVKMTCKNSEYDVKDGIKSCCLFYESSKNEISRLSPLARLVILKIIRPTIIDSVKIENFNGEEKRHGLTREEYVNNVLLPKIDAEIQQCIGALKNNFSAIKYY